MTRDLILLVADRATGEVMEGGNPSDYKIHRNMRDLSAIEMHEICANCGHDFGEHNRYTCPDSSGSEWRDKVDLSGAEVKLPERVEISEEEYLLLSPEGQAEIDAHNACLDAITAQMKGG